MKQNKLKLTNTKDRGLKPMDWVELVFLALTLVIICAVIFACVVAGIKVITEAMI